jgi:hypothetical protein
LGVTLLNAILPFWIVPVRHQHSQKKKDMENCPGRPFEKSYILQTLNKQTRDSKMSETKVNETKPSETKPRKVVRRSVAVALGIVCIILVAGLGVMAYVSYSPTSGSSNATLQAKIDQLQTWLDGNKTLLNQTQTWLSGNVTSYEAQISTLNARITQLQTWLDGNITAHNDYVATHSYTNDQYNAYVADHHHTDEDYANYYNIANLALSTVWVNDQTVSQPAGGIGVSYTSWTESASYAGYVSVWVQSSSVSGTHVRVIYSSNGVNFDQEIVVSVGGTAVFPILPSSVQVEVGNANLSGGATETVTITYHY